MNDINNLMRSSFQALIWFFSFNTTSDLCKYFPEREEVSTKRFALDKERPYSTLYSERLPKDR